MHGSRNIPKKRKFEGRLYTLRDVSFFFSGKIWCIASYLQLYRIQLLYLDTKQIFLLFVVLLVSWE